MRFPLAIVLLVTQVCAFVSCGVCSSLVICFQACDAFQVDVTLDGLKMNLTTGVNNLRQYITEVPNVCRICFGVGLQDTANLCCLVEDMWEFFFRGNNLSLTYPGHARPD